MAGTESQRKESYYANCRDDLIRLIPPESRRILEIGCGSGATGRRLRELGFEEVVGVEIIKDLADQALPFYKSVITGSVEEISLPYEKGHFDCILYGDVLEHLIDPWSLLKVHNRFLKTGGVIICSIPNIRHYKNTKKLLLKGEWEYRDSGILDRTHLRFFTLKSIETMVHNAGYEITTVIKRPSGVQWLKWLNKMLGNRIIDHLVLQYVFVGTKKMESLPINST